MNFSRIFIMAVTGIFVSSNPLWANNTLVFNTAFSSPISSDTNTGFGDVIIGEALRRIGYNFTSVTLPAERALINANLGYDDGDLLRIAGLQKIYPNLIQVPEKVMDMDVVIFTKPQNAFKVDGWNSLASRSIAILTGWKIFEQNLPTSVDLIKTDNVEMLFTLLDKDRVDMVGYNRWSGLSYIKTQNLANVQVLEPPIVSTGLYVYLHKKHADLVPKLAAALREIKADGTYQRAYDNILAPLLEK